LQISHRSNSKWESPRLHTDRLGRRGNSVGTGDWHSNRYEEEGSETGALAEGSLTNSENESDESLGLEEDEPRHIQDTTGTDINEAGIPE